MSVETIDSVDAFDRVRHIWDDIFKADREATIYVSFPWLRGFVAAAEHSLFVLAMRPMPGRPYAAFLPLTINKVHWGSLLVQRSLTMLGFPLADYTSMLCLPGYEDEAVAAFSTFLKASAWDSLTVTNVCDGRYDRLLASFGENKFSINRSDKSACPYILLPSDWDKYFTHSLDTDSRRNLKRRLRQMKDLPEVRVMDVSKENLDLQIETMISLNEARYGSRGRRGIFATIYRSCFEAGSLYLRTLWKGNTPIAANSGFIDKRRGIFYLYSSGFNPDYSRISPGIALTALTIQYALENGCRIFDFGRGGQRYKYSYGAAERFLRHWTIRRHGLRGSFVSVATRTASAARRLSSPFKKERPHR